jgi:hypothetical protein
MNKAKFKIGDVVGLRRAVGDGHIPTGEFVILRIMPSEGDQRSYRVRGKDGQERVLREEQIHMWTGGSAAENELPRWLTGRKLADLI